VGGSGQPFPEVGAGDAAIYDAKVNFFFATSNFSKGGALGVFGGSPVRWVANAPTAVGSHTVAYDETNRGVYTVNEQPGQAGVIAFYGPLGREPPPGAPSYGSPASSRRARST
jgi:hypothetical protein